MNDKIPYSKEAEQGVLGACLADPKVILDVVEIIKPEDFFFNEHQCIFQAITELFLQGKPLDIISVSEQLKKNGFEDKIPYLARLEDSVPAPANADYYAGVVQKKAVARELMKKGNKLVELASNEEIEKSKKLAFEIEEVALYERDDAFGELFDENFYKRAMEIKRWRSSSLGRLTKIVPFKRTETIVIGGAPSHGKSQLAINLAIDFVKQGADVGYYSGEMGKEQFATRLLNWEIAKDETLLPEIDFSQKEYQQLLKGLTKEEPYKSKLHFFDRSRKIEDIDRWVEAHHFDIIFLDYLQTIYASKYMKEYERISYVMDWVRTIMSRKRCVVLLSQMHRNEQKDKPTLSELRGSGRIEEDASSVILLYKEDRKNLYGEYKVAKNQTTGEVTGWLPYTEKPNGRFIEE